MTAAANGNGHRNGWTAAGVCSGVVFAIGGAFGSSYVRDQARAEARVTALEQARVEHAAITGRTEQRLEQLAEAVRLNAAKLERDYTNLDTVLQREMRLIDDRTREELAGLDRRLQTEIGNLATGLRERLTALEGAAANYWRLADQERFESTLGQE